MHTSRDGNRVMRISSSLFFTTCLRLMKTSMCQCCPGVAKTKHAMYNQADKRCILSPPTQTPIPSCQSVERTPKEIYERRKKPFLNDTSHSPDFKKWQVFWIRGLARWRVWWWLESISSCFFGSGSREMSLWLTLKLFSPALFNASKTRATNCSKRYGTITLKVR